jgi:hypothetical protein
VSGDTPARSRPGPRLMTVVDGLFFLLGAVAAAVLAVLTVRLVLFGGARDWWLLLVLWLVLAYLLLPRLHSILAVVYVPDYFIGRTRTYEGLLGDPVNVALQGSEEQVHAAMTRAGWRLADELGFRSALRIVTSTLTRRTYPTAPVSPLFLFGRMQAFTYQQEVEGSPARRHHVRFWPTPADWFLPGGAKVDWVAAGTYDKRVGLSILTLQITHKVAPATDRERDHIVATVLGANPDASGSVIPHFSSGYHARNGGGDAIRTDGDLPVLDLTRLPAGAARPGAMHGGLHHGSFRQQAHELVSTVRDTGASNRVERPLSLYLGYGLMLAHVLLGAAAAVAAALGLLPSPTGRRFLGMLPLPAEAGWMVPELLAAGAAYVVLGQLTFSGRTLPRFLTLALSVGGILIGILDGPDAPEGLAFQLWLVNLALDIGILVTLSGGDVRDFDLRTPGGRYVPLS